MFALLAAFAPTDPSTAILYVAAVVCFAVIRTSRPTGPAPPCAAKGTAQLGDSIPTRYRMGGRSPCPPAVAGLAAVHPNTGPTVTAAAKARRLVSYLHTQVLGMAMCMTGLSVLRPPTRGERHPPSPQKLPSQVATCR
jgi:hypothetical protein